MSVKGGYHILNLQNKDLQYSPTIPNAYESVEGSYQKPILISGINIGGVEKTDVYRMPTVSGSSYVFENVYGYDLTLNDDDTLSISSTQWATRSYVEQIVESGTLDNAKPLYWHSCRLYRTDGEPATAKYMLDFIIINNSEEALNLTTFGDFLNALPDGGEIKVLQGYDNAKPSNIVLYIKKGSAEGNMDIVSFNSSTGLLETTADWGIAGTFIDAGINKLN